ncbi:MAG: hypothetical protein QOJ84_2257 [Bradyrhizobium sp.]|nr:hypothetical protein [Bradyrhizobium sp.]
MWFWIPGSLVSLTPQNDQLRLYRRINIVGRIRCVDFPVLCPRGHSIGCNLKYRW